MNERIAKVNSLIQEELGKILVKEMIFPPGMLVTIISVDCSPDLKHTKVMIDTIPQKKLGQTLRILGKNIYNIQQILNGKLVMHHVPKIKFIVDEGQQKLERIDQLVKQVNKEKQNRNV